MCLMDIIVFFCRFPLYLFLSNFSKNNLNFFSTKHKIIPQNIFYISSLSIYIYISIYHHLVNFSLTTGYLLTQVDRKSVV